MTGNVKMLSEVINYNGTRIIFGDNIKGKTIGKCKIIHDRNIIKDLLFVENLCYKLIGII